MRISVIIPCHGGVEDTRRCLTALHDQVDAPALEILLVDNASPDATPELAHEFDDVRVLPQPENLGFAAGVNRGLDAATGELVLVLNNDTRAAPHMLGRLFRAMLSDSRIAAVAPVSNHVKGPARIDVGTGGSSLEGGREIETAIHRTWPGVLQDVDTLAGLCLLMRRDTLQAAGGFDERFGLGNFEDDDLSLRLRIRGHRLVLVRDAYLHHEGHRTFEAVGVDYRATLFERKSLFVAKWRHDPAGAVACALLEADTGSAQRLAARGLRHYSQWVDGHWHLARHLAATGDFAGAVQHLECFLEDCPAHGEARSELAFAHMDEGRIELGHQHLLWTLQHCYLSNVAGAEVLCRLGDRSNESGDLDTALDWYRNALDLLPHGAEIHNRMGTALMNGGRLDEALASFREAERLDSPYGATNTGICLWRLGRHSDGLRALKRAVDGHPGDPIIERNYATAMAACSAMLASV